VLLWARTLAAVVADRQVEILIELFPRLHLQRDRFAVGISFAASKIGAPLRYNKESAQAAGEPECSALTIAFQLDGPDSKALNGGPNFQFNEAISVVVKCGSQAEVDHYWNHLSEGGNPKAQQCDWLKNRYGVSWQVVPTMLIDLLTNPAPNRAQGDGGDAADEEDRHRGLAARGCRVRRAGLAQITQRRSIVR
jgi:predicted 3-demethylubiquinone-9 3-methyltransferase (glyoxalase superfamily)